MKKFFDIWPILLACVAALVYGYCVRAGWTAADAAGFVSISMFVMMLICASLAEVAVKKHEETDRYDAPTIAVISSIFALTGAAFVAVSAGASIVVQVSVGILISLLVLMARRITNEENYGTEPWLVRTLLLPVAMIAAFYVEQRSGFRAGAGMLGGIVGAQVGWNTWRWKLEEKKIAAAG